MADEPETDRDDARSANAEDAAHEELAYESNPKHSEPWQVGRRGSICEAEVRPLAQDLLLASVAWKAKRYAVHDGKACCGQEHSPDRWHGYPVGWVEVPPKVVRQWIRDGRLTNHDRKEYWEAH
jgi:hypothetical protein